MLARAAIDLGRDRGRGLHRLQPGRDAACATASGWSASTISPPAISATSTRRWPPSRAPRDRFTMVTGDIRDRAMCDRVVGGRRRRASPGRAGIGAAIDGRSARQPRQQCHRLPQHDRCRAPRRGRAVRLCRVELDLWRRSRASQARGADRPPAVALCRDQADRRDLRRGLRHRATAIAPRACAISTSSGRARTPTAPMPR